MWTGVIDFNELVNRACWKVEFFCGEAVADSKSPFELLPLRDLVKERRETLDPQTQPETPFNYLGLEHVEGTTGALINFSPVFGKGIKSRSKVFRECDVLYGRLRPYLNKVYVCSGEISRGICSGEFYVLAPNAKKILPHFLRNLLASELVHPFVSRWQTGSALPRLQLDDLLNLTVPVPPLSVQRQYEDFLVRQAQRYQSLVAEVSSLPKRTLSGFVAALNEGREELMELP